MKNKPLSLDSKQIDIDKFVYGANYDDSKPKKQELEEVKPRIKEKKYSWEEEGLSEAHNTSFNLKLTERQKMMLDFVHEKTGKSRQKIIREAFIPVLERLIEEYK